MVWHQKCYWLVATSWCWNGAIIKLVSFSWTAIFSVRNSPRQSANVEAFAEAYLCFLVSASAKKNAEAIKCLIRILKKYVAKNKIYFCFKKKRNVPLNKKVIFVFHKFFSIIHRCLHSLFILLSFSYIGF